MRNIKISRETWGKLLKIVEEEELDKPKYLKRVKDFCSIVPKNLPVNSRILDIGIGPGFFAVLLKSEFDYEIHGVDILRNECDEDMERQKHWFNRYSKFNISFQNCDITKNSLPYPDAYFDCVVFMEVLEHLITLHPPIGIFKDIKRVLKKKGILIFSVPNAVSLDKRIFTLLGSHPSSYGFQNNSSYNKHFREYTLKEVTWVLNKIGFEIKKVTMVNQKPIQKFSLSIGDILRFSTNYISRLYRNWKNTIIVVAQK